MASRYQQTSLITILSSAHGRLRREQRDIDKRDLQKALKYGTVEKCWNKRWKVEYDGIVFIVTQDKKREVTAYPSPLAFAPVEDKDFKAHTDAKKVVDLKPELAVSHTILVVDRSGSMNTHDIHLHRDRLTAAYSNTAMEFVAEQIFSSSANNSDLVSLIEFNKGARVIFTREPVSWVLYNKILMRRDRSDFKSRETKMLTDALNNDSNYLPALQEARRLLLKDDHDSLALTLFFLSDGSPTDAGYLDIPPRHALNAMCDEIKNIAAAYGKRLNITLVGFGSERRDFSALEAMARAASEGSPDTKAKFFYCGKMSSAIGSAVTSVATSLAETRTALMAHGGTRRSYTSRNIAREGDSSGYVEWKTYKIMSHFVFDPRHNEFIQYSFLPPGSYREEDAEALKARRQYPQWLAIKTKAIGSGAERVAFRCQLSDRPTLMTSLSNSSRGVLGPMVAKETDHHERVEEHVEFHLTFCATQSLAAYLANEFNSRLCGLPDYDEAMTPRIIFLPCSILVVEDPLWPLGRGVLVEKELNVDKFGWSKWNNNAGAVDGRVAHVPIDVDYELGRVQTRTDCDTDALCAIVEEDSEEDSSDEEVEESLYDIDAPSSLTAEFDEDISIKKPSDYLQAFSHFTYLHTCGKLLVCDLQGVYNTDMVPPTFELSDPAIHYVSKKRDCVYGRTDKGRKGIQLFFNTHQCTKVCKILKLSKKNKEWRRRWEEEARREKEYNKGEK